MSLIKHLHLYAIGLFIAVIASGCATTSDVVINPSESGHVFTTAFLVTHGGKSVDMDDAFKAALLQRGLKITEGENQPQQTSTDIVVKYDDTWRWDLAMYLLKLDVQIYDGKTGALVADSTWHNSPAHGYPDIKTVVAQLLDQTFAKLNSKMPTP